MSALADIEAQMSRRVTPAGSLVLPANAPREAWLDAREQGITGTDLPKILGLVTWGNAIDVYLDKRRPGRDRDRRPSEAAEWGQLLEEPIARKWAADRGAKVRRVGLIRSTRNPRHLATCDRLVVGESAALEVKTRSAFAADEWDDGVPDRVLAQVQWQLYVTGLPLAYVAALVGGQSLASFEVRQNRDMQAWLVEEADRVWAAVESGEPPEVAPEHMTAASLNRLYTERDGAVELPPEAADLLADYRAAAATVAELARAQREAEAARDLAKLQLLTMAGPAEVATLDGQPVFTYKAHQTMRPEAAQLRAFAADHPDLAARYGIAERTTRTFRLTRPKQARPTKGQPA